MDLTQNVVDRHLINVGVSKVGPDRPARCGGYDFLSTFKTRERNFLRVWHSPITHLNLSLNPARRWSNCSRLGFALMMLHRCQQVWKACLIGAKPGRNELSRASIACGFDRRRRRRNALHHSRCIMSSNLRLHYPTETTPDRRDQSCGHPE